MSKLIIYRQDKRERYCTIDKRAITDTRLSLAARGLHLFLLDKCDGWETTAELLAKQNNESLYAIKKCLSELKKYGYVKVTRLQGATGKLDACTFSVWEVPPSVDNQPMDKTIEITPLVDIRPVDETQTSKAIKADESNIIHFAAPLVDIQPVGISAEKTAMTVYSPLVDIQPDIEINRRRNKQVSTPAKPVHGKKSSGKVPASEPKISSNARKLVNHLSDCLKQHGAKEGQFDKQWFFKSCVAAEDLLKLESFEDLKNAITFLVDDPYIGQNILTMYSVKNYLNRWQRSQQEGPRYTQKKGKYSVADGPQWMTIKGVK